MDKGGDRTAIGEAAALRRCGLPNEERNRRRLWNGRRSRVAERLVEKTDDHFAESR